MKKQTRRWCWWAAFTVAGGVVAAAACPEMRGWIAFALGAVTVGAFVWVLYVRESNDADRD